MIRLFLVILSAAKNLIKYQRKIHVKTVSEFTRQLATLLQAHIQLLPALELLKNSTTHQKLQLMLSNLIKDIASGSALSQAMAKYPQYFDQIYYQLVRAGERASALPQIFENLANYQEKNLILKMKLQKALLYPIIVLIIAMLISIGLLLFIVPQFEQIFSSFGATLPWMTLVIIQTAKFLQNYGLFLSGFLFLIIIIIFYAKQKFKTFAELLENIFLKLPIIGPLQHKAITTRIARTLAITYNAGVPIIDALSIIEAVSASYKYSKAIIVSREAVIKGELLSAALAKTKLFSPLFIQMIRVGEEAGALSIMLEKTAVSNETQIDHAVSQFSSLLEPMIMVFLGLLIGGLVIAMYLPVFKLGSVVSL